MKYLYNYNYYPNFNRGELYNLFVEELEKVPLKNILIKDKGVYIKIIFDEMFLYLNNDTYFISDLVDYDWLDNYISITVERIKTKEFRFIINDKDRFQKLIKALDYIKEAKDIALEKYYERKEDLNNNYKEFNFKIRIDSEDVFYMYYGDLERMSKEEQIQLVQLEESDNKIYIKIKNDKFLINKKIYPYIYNTKIDNIYCSNIEIVSTLENYFVDIEMDLLIKI